MGRGQYDNLATRDGLDKFIDEDNARGTLVCCPDAKSFCNRSDDWKCTDYCPFPFCLKEDLAKANGNTRPYILRCLKEGKQVRLVNGKPVITEAPPKRWSFCNTTA